MQPQLKIGIIAAMALTLSGCATSGLWSGSSTLRNSELSNLNPAPASMAPPVYQPGDEGEIGDPVYMRTQADYHYTLGEALSMEGQPQRAIEEFRLTLVYDPKSVMVRLRIAAEFVKQGLLSEAIEQAEEAVKTDPDSLEGRLLLGGLYSSMKMYNLALKHYRHLLTVHPENPEAPVYIGAILAEQGKYDEAEVHFKKLAESKKFKEPHLAHYYIGRIRAEQGGDENLAKAEKAYLKAITLTPDHEDSVLSLAKIYELKNEQARALKLLESFQRQFGPNRKVAQKLSQHYLEVENYAKALEQLEYLEGFEPENLNVKVKTALIQIELKNYDRAIVKLEEIVATAPDSDKIRFYLGAVYEEVQDPKLAIEHFSKIPSSSQYYAEAVVHVAHLYKTQNELDKAIQVVREAIGKRNDVPQFYAYYASLLDEKRDYLTAVKMLSDAVAAFPTHTQLRFFLGSMQDKVGNTDKTIEEMKRVLEIDEDHVQALNYLAYTYAEKNQNLESAEVMARRALELQPDDGYILDTLGWIKFKKGDIEQSIRYLEAAHRAKSDESIIAEHLADAYFRYQLIEKAKKMYMKAVSLETDLKKIQEIQTKLGAIESQQIESKRQPAAVGR